MTTTPDAPVVTLYSDDNPTPRAEILATLPPDAETFTIWRVTPSTRERVRGAVDALAASPIVWDYEIPFGIPVTYQVQTRDAGEVPSEISAGSAPVRLDDVADVWLSDPLDPSSAMAVSLGCAPRRTELPVLLQAAWDELSYVGTTEVLAVAGSRLGIASSKLRRAPAAVMAIMARNPQQASNLRALFEMAVPLLIRTPSTLTFVDGAYYAAVGDITEKPYWPEGQSIFSFSTESVRGPGATLVVYPRSWDDLLDEAASWDELAQLYATWNDVARGGG